MSQVRKVSFGGETIRFWMAAPDPIVRLPALHAEWSLGGLVVEDPASRGHLEDYSEQELVRLLRRRSSFSL